MSEEIDLRASWDRLAPYYQRRHAIPLDIAHYGTNAPNEDQLQLLGSVAGKRILELGCGGGQCSIAFARQGASCVGVDFSAQQLVHARLFAEQAGVEVEFVCAEMAEFLEMQRAASFDIVFSAYALQYVEDLARVFRLVRRVLRDGGLFVFSLDHPLNNVTCYRDNEVRFYESYFARGRSEWNWETDRPEEPPHRFYSFHRTVGDFVNLLAAAGFWIERCLEPEATAEADPWGSMADIERWAVVPATIIWKARALPLFPMQTASHPSSPTVSGSGDNS
ncbi:MAG: class I SAM-dependent methyltransferase [Chloroherpetonaceae bacterium]|nr:class I SAM-dependent methyltransferase [Chthonomonadaceae bacterium]MDW8206391.1 class I SAM-dependent methyltransferase [Chloroherpetonaceae bacterium]